MGDNEMGSPIPFAVWRSTFSVITDDKPAQVGGLS